MNVRKHFLISFILIIILIQGILTGPVMSATTTDKSVIIGFRHPVGPQDDDIVKSHGALPKKNFHLIPALAATIPEGKIAELKNDPNVLYVENNSIFSIADVYSDEYNNSWGVQHIGSQVAHDNGFDGKGVNISVLDTGIDYNNIDLKDNYKGGYNFVNFNADPWDDNCLSQFKECHGTHVSGIVGAEKNGIGVVGVAPNANIYAVKVLNGGGLGDVISIVSGLEWAIDNKMDIVSMSFGSIDDSIAVHTAIDNAYNAGLLLVAAAGNTFGGSVTYPAGYDSVIAVTATNSSDMNSDFDPISPKIELAAPGVNITSTIGSTINGGYGVKSGTSMAAPHVAGVAAMIWDKIGNNKDIRELLHSAKDLGVQGRDSTYGYGLVDARFVDILKLTRTTGPESNDAKSISLSQGNYSIYIHDINLSKVDVKVVENGNNVKVSEKTVKVPDNGIIRKESSGSSTTYKFNKSKDIQFQINVDDNSTIVFTPYGGKGTSGYVVIKDI